MTIEEAIAEKVRVLSPEQQQQVLAFIESLQTGKWEQLYQGRFKQLQQGVQIGIDAADRGEVVDAEAVFQRLQGMLQQRHIQVGK
jgi:hypothetical protein